MHTLLFLGIPFGLLCLIFGARGAALIVVWLVVSLIIAGQGLGEAFGWWGLLLAMTIAAVPFVAFMVARQGWTERSLEGYDDDAILREAVRRAQRDEEDRQHNMAVLRKYFADEMERRLKRDGYHIPPSH
jgi:hypothetical protein